MGGFLIPQAADAGPVGTLQALALSRTASKRPITPEGRGPGGGQASENMNRLTAAATGTLLGVAGVFGACSPRALPATFPATSAASTEAPEARRIPVTVALEQDPPLPGESVEQWPGLRTNPGSGGGHANHHHGADPGNHAGDAPKQPPPGKAPDAGAAPAKVTYTCPMHPDVVSDHPGSCPRCGMTLVPRK
jgi:hypothetical protein